MLLPAQILYTSFLVLTLIQVNAEAPPGYVKTEDSAAKDAPKYEYGYNIQDEKGTSHGKLETRDGIYALGRYYVQNVDSSQNVQYYADDWGYHPFIEYSNVGPHSRTKTQLLLGVEAVKALASNKFTPNSLPAKQHVTDIINSKINNRDGKQVAVPQNHQQQNHQTVVELQQPQVVIEQPQQVIAQQNPQTVELQQRQVVIEQPQQVIAQQNHHTVELQQPQVVIEQPQQVIAQQNHHTVELQQPQVVIEQPQQVIAQQNHQTLELQQPQVVIEQPQQVIAQQNHQRVELQQPQEVVVEQPQQVIVQHQPQVVAQRPQHVLIEQPQQVVIQHQPQFVDEQQNQQVVEQPQQTPVENTDSITVEASNRQTQLNQQQELPQLEQVLSEQEISFQQSPSLQEKNSRPQLEQIQIREGISHQQSLGNDKQIQDNLVVEKESGNHRRIVQQTHSNLGGFGSQLNLLGRIPLNINRQFQQTSGRLIETTKNLVSGQDVLNINGAIDQSVETSIESSTLRNVLEKDSVRINNLLQEPIVVADVDNVEQVKENIFSTTANTIETVSTKSFGITEPSTLLVTPRPVSTNFLAPITAGIQLQQTKPDCNQNVAQLQHSQSSEKIESTAQKENYLVEIQKSVPYYLGKYEYGASAVENLEGTAVENIELGKTLLALPGQNSHQKQQQQLPELSIKENFVDVDQQQAQGNQLQKVATPDVPLKVVEKPVQVTRFVPVEIRVPIEKHIPVPVTVEKIVEKPVKVTEIVEKRVHVPQPVPVEVTRYIDRPYPVQVPVATPVPYPVERVVEKIVKQPYPVEVRVPVEVKVPVPVEKKVPVPQFIEKQVPHFIDRPYPVPVAQIYTLQFSKALPIVNQQRPQPSQKISVTVRNRQQMKQNQFLQSGAELTQPLLLQVPNNGYLPPSHNCDQHGSYSGKNLYYTIQPDDYIGLLPPRLHDDGPTKFRNPRSNFNSNLRLEYGFMPPLRPSQEIDEHGNPITREKP